MRWMGRTLCSETAAAFGDELETGADALVPAAPPPVGLKAAHSFC